MLVVEDEPVLRASLVRGLARLPGIDVVGAGTVRDARRSIGVSPPDLVIADLDLPDGSGIEVAGELDRVGLRVPIVFVSAYVGRYRGRLPQRVGNEVLEKPVALERLRRLVAERLDGGAETSSSPFGVPDYVQLAGMGRRSVVIDVRGRVAGRGEIVIRGGEVWSARDERGEGLDAFRRLAFVRDAVVTCRAHEPVKDDTARTIHGSCESVLLDAARCLDEAEGGGAVMDDEWEAGGAPAPVTPSHGFDELFEDGVDALLGKRFAEAFRAFDAADRMKPGDPRVQANLERLRQMGHAS